MTGAGLPLEWIDGRYAICRLEPDATLPSWLPDDAGLVSVTRTDRELSIVVLDDAVPNDIQAERGYAAMRVATTLEFTLTGIISRLCDALATAGVPVFVMSTFDTDVLLIRDEYLEVAVSALRRVADVSRL